MKGLGLGTHSKRAEPISPDEEALWAAWYPQWKGFTEYSVLLQLQIFELHSYDGNLPLLNSLN